MIYITRGGVDRIDMLCTSIHILLYADHIILVFESHGNLQHHLNDLDGFCQEKGLVVLFAL